MDFLAQRRNTGGEGSGIWSTYVWERYTMRLFGYGLQTYNATCTQPCAFSSHVWSPSFASTSMCAGFLSWNCVGLCKVAHGVVRNIMWEWRLLVPLVPLQAWAVTLLLQCSLVRILYIMENIRKALYCCKWIPPKDGTIQFFFAR